MEDGYFNNPSKMFQQTVSCSLGTPEFDNEIVVVLKEVFPTFFENDSRRELNFSTTMLTGGITNILVLAKNHDNGKQVIVRIFGLGTSEFIDRDIENYVFAALSKSGLGPLFHGLFLNGRVEGYINARALIPAELYAPDIFPNVASAIAQLHRQDIKLSTEVFVWKKIEQFIQLSEHAAFPDNEEKQQRLDKFRALNNVNEDLVFLHHHFNQVQADLNLLLESDHTPSSLGQLFAFEMVLAHNDLLSGNILMAEGEDSSVLGSPNITLIDYEYVGFNYRAYDIANHFIGTLLFEIVFWSFSDNFDILVCYFQNSLDLI